MQDKEKILRWNLQEAIKELNSDIGEVPLASWYFKIKEQRRRKVEECQRSLNKYLESKNV